MTSQTEGTGFSAKTEWVIIKAGDIAIYTTLILGYFFSLVGARNVLPRTFLIFTAVNALYGLVTWWMLRRNEIAGWQKLSGMVILSALTFSSGMLTKTSIAFDWLLYFATVGSYIYLLSTRTALTAALLLYLVVLLNIGLLNGWGRVFQGSISLLAGFGFIIVFSYSNRLLIVERERSRRLLQRLEASRSELEGTHRQLQEYADEIEELTIARERTRMAREIHDTLGHYLTILNVQLETISKLQERNPERAMLEVAEARRVAAQSMQEVRNAVAALRPNSIATLNLAEALTQLGEEFKLVAGETRLTLDLDTSLPPLSHDLQLALYRTAQEALTNVRKHAHATKVLLRLRYEGETVELVVLDNGTSQNAPSQLVQPGGNSERGYGRIKGGKEARSVLRCPIRKQANLM